MYLRQLTLMVKDLEESIEFYEIITELTISRRFENGPAELAFLSNGNGGTEIELVYAPQVQKLEGKGFFICFVTDKSDATYELAQSKELNPSGIRNPDVQSRYFYVYDLDRVSVQPRQKI